MTEQSILYGYTPSGGDYDELVDTQGNVRDNWSYFANRIEQISPDALVQRKQLLDKIIADNGITYNVYSDQGETRRWIMDLLPLIFSKSDWINLEQGLQQRAELMNQIYQDLYGRQELIHEGQLPPYLVYANPAFLRPCASIEHSETSIHLYAADIARSPDGKWWILSDRIEAPSGLGYVMENRSLSSRVMPEFFRDDRVSSLRPFYDTYINSLKGLAPPDSETLSLALLTPGTANETYHDQSFLARNLGIPLIEGADLTVRDNTVYLKTLTGIKPLSVLLRRVDSEWCDPLELRNESMLGTPGLINALRQKTISVSNMPGSALMETVAFPAFLNSLCEYFRGEGLKIPSVATWWCGQPRELKYVIENINKLVIKRTFREKITPAIFGPTLSKDETDQLVQQIQKRPESFCAQEVVSKATAPVYSDSGIHSHHFLVRVYLARTNGSYKLLPGGLARIAPSPESMNVSMQHGGLSKDIWILDETGQKKRGAQSATLHGSIKLKPPQIDLSSRTANNMLWLGRYVERVESLARQLRIILSKITQQFELETVHSLAPFISLLVTEEEYEEIYKIQDPAKLLDTLDDMLRQYVWDPDCWNSLKAGFNHIHRIANSVKERLSVDTAQILSYMENTEIIHDPGQSTLIHERNIEALEDALDWLAAFYGMTAENMVRSPSWHFLMLGRRIERTFNLNSFLSECLKIGDIYNENTILYLLEYSDSTISYKNRYLNSFHPLAIIDLLMKDGMNPRSIQFNIDKIGEHIIALPGIDPKADLLSEVLISYNRLSNDFAFIEPNTLFKDGELIEKDSLVSFLERQMDELEALSKSIEQQFFAHVKKG